MARKNYNGKYEEETITEKVNDFAQDAYTYGKKAVTFLEEAIFGKPNRSHKSSADRKPHHNGITKDNK